MKKTRRLLALLALLSAVGLGGAHCMLSASSQQVSFQEIPLSGGLSAADGLTVDLSACLEDQLFWDTTFAPDRKAETNFRFEPMSSQRTRHQASDSHFALYAVLDFGSSISGSHQFPDDAPWLKEAFRELDEATPEGATRSKEVLVSDYETVYLSDIHLSTPYQNFYMNPFENRLPSDPAESAFFKSFQQAFSFPVSEGHRQILTLTKDAANDSCALSCANVGAGVTIDSKCCVSSDALYFIVIARSDVDGSLLDYSHTPGGYGVYRLPLDREELTMEDLDMVYALDPAQDILEITYHAPSNHLVLVTQEGIHTALRVVDLTRQQEVQSFPLWESDQNQGITLNQDGDLLLLSNVQGDAMLFQQDEQGLCTPRLELTLPDLGSYGGLRNRYLSMAWNGQQLALAIQAFTPQAGIAYSSTFNASFSLFVYDKDGLQYGGAFQNSLDAGISAQNYSWSRCCLYDKHPLSIHWN